MTPPITVSQAEEIAQRLWVKAQGRVDRAELRAAAYDGAALMVPAPGVKQAQFMPLRPLVGDRVMDEIEAMGPWTWGDTDITLVSRDAMIDWLAARPLCITAYDTVCRLVPVGVYLDLAD